MKKEEIYFIRTPYTYIIGATINKSVMDIYTTLEGALYEKNNTNSNDVIQQIKCEKISEKDIQTNDIIYKDDNNEISLGNVYRKQKIKTAIIDGCCINFK